MPETSKPTSPSDLERIGSGEPLVTKIALVRTADRNDGVRRAISLLESNPIKAKEVALKPNFNTADPAPGSTHNDTLRALVSTLREMGAKRITLAERSGPPDTREVMEKKGILKLAQEMDFDVINLQELGPEGWVHLEPEDSHWEHGFHFARAYLEAESIVQTCCLKTHAYGGHFTLSLKNSVGMVPRTGYPYMGELHRSPYQRQMIAEINAAYKPDLILLDGVDAFVKGGPDQGTRVKADVILAGNDRVAIDAVGVAILRLFGTTTEVSKGLIFDQDQIARAVELGLGVRSPTQIQLVTDDHESEVFAKQVSDTLLRG
ncbi:MAG: DUF362 domain-containing protein [Dehalococcoidia bacterium]|nr:MAG: DUF362 domain-containing protein [Dehalococcoidia bacterium]